MGAIQDDAGSPPPPADTAQQRLRMRRWQRLTVGLLVAGYSGYYLCRSNFSVALPMIVDELAARGIDPSSARVRLGAIASAGTIAYALGKPFGGSLADALGGRRNFLAGMAGAVVFTIAFALGGTLPVFTLAWMGNRLLQSLGWVGMVKISSRWFAYSTYGGVMAILSLSYLFGDAVARAFMGILIAGGLGWRGVFLVDAGVLLALLVVSARLVRESPAELGLEEPPASPSSVYGEEGQSAEPTGLAAVLAPLAASRSFWLVCLISLGVTFLRETFNTWTPTYFTDGLGLSQAAAARSSALFPLCGGISVLIAGPLGDRLGRPGRALIILAGLALAGALLVVLGRMPVGPGGGGSGSGSGSGSAAGAVALVAAVAFLLMGPYSYLAGALALDFGGKRGGATASGLIDFFGYLGGMLAGFGMARVSVSWGWTGVFGVLAGAAWLSSVVAALFLIDQRRTARGGGETS